MFANISFYAGAPPLNRVSFQRTSTEKITGYLESSEARFLLFKWAPEAFPCGCMQDEDEADKCPNPLSQGQPLCKDGVPGELLFLSRQQVEGALGGSFAWVIYLPSLIARASPQAAPEPKLYEAARIPHTLPAIVFLGIDDRPDASETSVPAEVDPENPKGVPFFAVDASSLELDLQGGGFVEGRAAGTALSAWEAGVFAEARALIDWNARNKVRRYSILSDRSSAQLVAPPHTLSGAAGSASARPPSHPRRARHPASPQRACITSHIPVRILSSLWVLSILLEKRCYSVGKSLGQRVCSYPVRR